MTSRGQTIFRTASNRAISSHKIPNRVDCGKKWRLRVLDYQFVRSDEITPTATSCELIEVTTALACASGDPALAVQVKAGIGRFFADLTKTPYKSIFNSGTSGAKAFNATVIQRNIDQWIEQKKKSLPKKSGPAWGVLVHGNRILSAAVFKKSSVIDLAQPIVSFPKSLDTKALHSICGGVYTKMVDTV